MKKVAISRLSLDLPLRGGQIGDLRKLFAANFGGNDLFHNHDENGNSMYRYPFIQYRVRHSKAQVVGIGPGSEILTSIVKGNGTAVHFKEWPFQPVRITGFGTTQEDLGFSQESHWFHMAGWLPLRDDSYSDWVKAEDLVSRIRILEDRLAAHILTFCRAVGYTVPDNLGLNLQQIIRMRRLTYKESSFVGFDVVFSANMMIPVSIGLGHGVSHGFGIVHPVTKFKLDQDKLGSPQKLVAWILTNDS